MNKNNFEALTIQRKKIRCLQIHDFEVLPNVLVITGSAVKRGHPHSQCGGVCGSGWHIMSDGKLQGWRVVPGYGGPEGDHRHSSGSRGEHLASIGELPCIPCATNTLETLLATELNTCKA